MADENHTERRATLPTLPTLGWEPPAFEVISLDCEITAYAPDGNDPLF